MIRSIRGRLLLWYAVVLTAVVVGFAGLLYYRVREARFQEIDARLESAALYLDAALRSIPAHELTGGPRPERPPRPLAGPRPDDRPGRPLPRGAADGGGRKTAAEVLAELAPPGFQPAPAGEEGPYFGIWRYDGTLLRAAALPEGTAAPVQAPPPQRGALLLQSGRLREAVVLGPHSTRILVGLPIGRELTALSAFAWQLAGVGACVLAVGLAGGWLLSGRLLRPIARISATASAISADNLTQRIDARQIDSELAGLARVLNDMFDRLEAAFARQAQFTADASHELRTPLAILRTHAELALSRPRKPEEYRETLETCLRAAGRMTGLVEGLLTLARADAGGLELKREPVDLARVAADMIELFEPLALRKDVALKAELEPVTVTGDSGRLCQVLTNLLSNAVQYNRPGGVVCVRLTRQGHDAVLAVSDTGLGIPDIDKPHLFGRFYRVDKARSRDSGGNGLGLAITRSIVQAHGGAIDFESQVGHGSTFRVRLPCDTPPPR